MKHSYLLSVLVISLISSTSGHQNETQPAAWAPLITNQALSKLASVVLPVYVDFPKLFKSENLEKQCRDDLELAYNALNSEARPWWAFSLFNSWGKFLPSGALRGTLTDYGDYDQCMEIVTPITSQYCLVDLSLPMPTNVPRDINYFHKTEVLPAELNRTLSDESVIRKFGDHSTIFYFTKLETGICIPSSCQRQNVQSYLNNELAPYKLNVTRLECQTKPKPITFSGLNTLQKSAVILFLSVFALTLYAAIYDRSHNKGSVRTTPMARVDPILWFSPFRNIRKLLHISYNADELRSIHGLRFMTMCWIIIGHALDWNPLEMLRDNFLMKYRLSSLLLQPLYKGFNSVETFFFISGLLTSILVLRNTRGDPKAFKNGPFLWIRYLRLTPQLIVYLLGTSLVPLFMDGPIWRRLTSKIDRCYSNWWLNLTYMTNFVDVKNICELQTWYLSVDMQMHWFSIIPIAVLLRHGRYWATVCCAAIIFASVCVSSASLTLEDFPPGSVYTWRSIYYTAWGQMGEFHERFLYYPWNHSILFFGGLVFGFYLEEAPKRSRKEITEKTKGTLSVSRKYVHWFGVLGLYLFCIYATTPYIWGRAFDGRISAILFPAQQTAWAAMIAWLIWLCSSGNGGAFGRIVCWRGWQPLSRLTYAVYLSHGWILYFSIGSVRSLIDYHPVLVTFWVFGLILVSYFVGFLFGILFETPLINFLDEMKHRFVQVPVKDGNGNDERKLDYELSDGEKFLSSNEKPSKDCDP